MGNYYVLYKPMRPATRGRKPPTPQVQARELLDWKRAAIRGLRNFPQSSVQGFKDDGIVVLLQEESREYLALLQRELPCTFLLYRPSNEDLRDLLKTR